MFGFYGLIRVIFWILMFFIINNILKKRNIINKERTLTYIFLLCMIVSYFINIEYIFLKFNSPKTAYYYTNFIKKVSFLIKGENTIMIVASDNSVDFVVKDNDKWKIRKDFYSLKSHEFGQGSIPFVTYKYNNDCYVKFTIRNNENNNISDNRNTTFYKKKRGSEYDYYGYIKDFDTDYILNIDENTYTLEFWNGKFFNLKDIKDLFSKEYISNY